VRPTLTQSEIENILKLASDLLQKTPNSCPVGFKLSGPVTTFNNAPAIINNGHELEEVHSVPADVKVVQRINFCLGVFDQEGFLGCAWRPKGRKTVIVTTEMVGAVPGRHPNLWAHEFGHTTGLPHRTDADDVALMLREIKAFHKEINSDECDHLRAGPVP
jgi:hypothetical protein